MIQVDYKFDTIISEFDKLPLECRRLFSYRLYGVLPDKKVSYIPKRFHQVRFDQIKEQFKPDVREILDSLFTSGPKGIFLCGDVGVGKTAILRKIEEYLMKGIFVRELKKEKDYGIPQGLVGDVVDRTLGHIKFIKHAELIKDLRRYHENKEGFKADQPPHYNTFALFLDDLGRDNDSSSWNVSLLEELIDYRWENEKLTFVSTNKGIESLDNWEGYSRIVDRLLDRADMIGLNFGKEEKSRRRNVV